MCVQEGGGGSEKAICSGNRQMHETTLTAFKYNSQPSLVKTQVQTNIWLCLENKQTMVPGTVPRLKSIHYVCFSVECSNSQPKQAQIATLHTFFTHDYIQLERLRRWSNIKTSVFQRGVFAAYYMYRPSKHDTLEQLCFNVGPASQTLGQH